MSNRTKRAFILSSVAHGACLLGLAVATLLSKCSQEEPPIHVFKLVSSPPPSATVSPPAPPPSRPRVVKPVTPKQKPPAPKPVKPKPRPPKKVIKKPAPRPTVKKPETPPAIVNFADYRKKHPVTPPRPAPPTPVRTQNFNPDDFRIDVKIPDIQIVGNVSTRDPDVLSRYLGRVKSIIEKEWRRLKAGSSLRSPGNLVVETKVQFRIGPSGDLRSPRLARASSYSEFDRLVLRALQGVRKVGQPPFTIDSPLQMTFRLN